MVDFITIISILLAQLPGAIVRYLPFSLSIDKIQKKKLFTYYFLCFLAQFIILYLAFTSGVIKTSPLNYKRIIFLFSFSYTFITVFVIKGVFFKHLFIFGMQGGYSLLIHTVVAICMSLYGTHLPLHLQLLVQSLSFIILFVLVAFPIWKYVKNSLIFKTASNHEYYWNIIWLIPTIAVCSNSLISMEDDWLNNFPGLLSRILMALALFVSWKCVSLDFMLLEKMEFLKNTNKMLHIQSESIKKQAELIEQNDTRNRLFNHDMRHNLQILSSLIESDNKTEAKKLILDLNDSITTIKPITFCKNAVINSALLIYISKAWQENIEVRTDINIPENLPWNNNDLAILYSNALDNAVNASLEQSKEHRHIEVISTFDKGTLAISIKNKYDGTITFGKTGLPITNKANHGIGTHSILSVVNKYNAHLSYSHKDGWFNLLVLFSTTVKNA